MTTGAITDAYVNRAPAAPGLSEEDAVTALLAGHGEAYTLPPGVLNAAAGAAALLARATGVHNELNASTAALESAPSRLVAEIVRASATSGAVPKTPDIGAEMVRLTADVDRLRLEDRILTNAAEKIATYPSTIIRSNAAAVLEALDAGLAALVAAAAPHSARLAAVEPEGDNALVAAFRVDPRAYDNLSLLVPRLAALEAAGQAMARLGTAWRPLPADDGTPDILRLAGLAG